MSTARRQRCWLLPHTSVVHCGLRCAWLKKGDEIPLCRVELWVSGTGPEEHGFDGVEHGGWEWISSSSPGRWGEIQGGTTKDFHPACAAGTACGLMNLELKTKVVCQGHHSNITLGGSQRTPKPSHEGAFFWPLSRWKSLRCGAEAAVLGRGGCGALPTTKRCMRPCVKHIDICCA